MRKLSDAHQEIALARIAKGESQAAVAAWLKKHHRVSVTPQAIAKVVRRHRSERADTAKVIAREHIARTLPTDLETMDRIQARNVQLLEFAQTDALKSPSQANVEKVVKLSTIVQRADEQKKRAVGLEQPDEVIGDLAALLAKIGGGG